MSDESFGTGGTQADPAQTPASPPAEGVVVVETTHVEVAAPAGAATSGMEAHPTKLCVLCYSEIDGMAIRCAHCGGFLPTAEGTDFKQHWSLLFACTAMFVAAVFLPFEGKVLDLYAKDSVAGGFLTVFAAYGMLVGFANIFHRKMIMWPAFLAAVDGAYLVPKRLIQVLGHDRPDTKEEWLRLGGPGLYVIALATLVVLWTLVAGVAAGAKKDKARKEAAKAARKQR